MRFHTEPPARSFVPGTVFWRVNREWLVTLAGSRAVLLELAHPLIAAGVAQYSNYRGDPFGRLFRTLRTMTALTFGDPRAARRAAQHFRGCHRRVRGVLNGAIGPYPAGTPYDADDPFLKLWVLGTLIDSVIRVYELFIAPLTAGEKESYYRETQSLAEWLDLSPALMPAGYEDFAAYMDAMLASDLLVVGDTARGIVAALYGPWPFGPLARQASFVGIGLLPERLRAAFNLKWRAADTHRLMKFAAWSRRLRPLLPDALLVQPLALRVEWGVRLRGARAAGAAS
jgi:uncharacterized protein (DUF2236 family)